MADGNFGNVTATGNILAAGYISAAGNITGSNLRANTISSNSLTFISPTTSNLAVGNLALYNNLSMTGTISAAGNVRGSYIFGNGSQLTGIVATSANALTGNTLSSNIKISSLTAVGTLTSLNVTGNIAANNISSNSLTFISPTTANLAVGNLALYNNLNMTGTISTSGNVTAARLVGNIVTANQPNITNIGTLSTLSVGGNITSGNLSVTGNIRGNVVFGQSLSVTNDLTANNALINALTFNSPTTANLIVGNIALYNNLNMTGNLSASGNIIASNFNGPAFMATITSAQGIPTSPFAINQFPLIFNSVSQNINNGYNPTTGIFTAPKSGFYQVSAAFAPFTANILLINLYYSAAVLGIYRNNVAFCSGTYNLLQTATYGGITYAAISASSVSSLVYLNVGDTLQCKVLYVTNAPNSFWNTFANAIPNYFQACWLRN